MAGILGVKPVSQEFPGNCQDTCLNQKKRFSSPAYTLKIETEGSYLRGYDVMTEQTQKQYRQHATSNLSTKLS